MRAAQIAAAFAALHVVPIPLQAQDASPPLDAAQSDLSPEMTEAIERAERRGRELYLYDQAAWHATDLLMKNFDRKRLERSMQGYVVLPRDDGRKDAIFYGDFGQGSVEVARYLVDESKVVSGGVLSVAERSPLSHMGVRMAAARSAAIKDAARRKLPLCANARANTVVLPPDPVGNIEVYVLTPPTSNSAYPIGGHYRLTLDHTGRVIASHSFSEDCRWIMLPHITEETVGFMSTALRHDTDPQPTEIHVFASYHRSVPVAFKTPMSGRTWLIDRGKITATDDDVSRVEFTR